ncbi:MAG: Na(+)/H(+) antiporter subunit B [Pseudomonadota bacterium]
MTPHVVLRVVAKLLIPMIVVFGFFVHFHGEYSPGGGFQAGVVLGSAIILYALIYGMEAAQKAVPPWWTRIGMALGSMIFAGVGFVTLMLGGNYLDYDVLHPDLSHAAGQHIGIISVEIGVLMTVTSVIIAIFYAFGGRRPDISDEEW